MKSIDVDIDDDLLLQLEARAIDRGLTLDEVANDALRAAFNSSQNLGVEADGSAS